MKNTILITLFTLSITSMFAQTPEESCYHSYFQVFKERGTYPMTDGEYDDVIISESSVNGTFCYTGKAIVQNGKVNNMYLKFVDGEYERINKEFKTEEKALIYDGVSVPRETLEGVRYVVFFTSKLKSKRKAYIAAPNPADLLNN